MVIVPITAIATSSTIAPRIEVYTMLACSVHKPDIFKETYRLGRPLYDDDILYNSLLVHQVAPSPTAREGFWAGNVMNGTVPNPPGQNLCASDPVVRAEVAKLTTSEWNFLLPSLMAKDRICALSPTVITTLTGLLSCITTSWWGAVRLPPKPPIFHLTFYMFIFTVLRSTWPHAGYRHLRRWPSPRRFQFYLHFIVF